MARSTLNSKLFWELMDRWQVADPDALTLIGHAGGLTGKGTRPRFALDAAEARRTTNLIAIERQLLEIHGKAAAPWLKRRNRAEPFGGKSPLGFMIAGGGEAIDATRRHVEMMALKASL